MSEIADFDKMVGRIAGAIYMDISFQFPHPPLMLVPPMTFKVRNVLEQIRPTIESTAFRALTQGLE